MHEMALDSFDHAILRALQADAALTNAELGVLVNLSASQCSRRRQALERAGVIEGYGARINGAALGFGLRAITRVNLRAHSESDDDAFAAFLRSHDQVISAHSVSGDADYVLEIYVRDLADFAAFIHRHLLPHPQVLQVRSEIVLQTTKAAAPVPLDMLQPRPR
ncbi:Lrp/AsnC family transcriptional regulator [Plastorhodobacter daqingensis]|uniref:Lrp/AsnC family transcriptional regulator n=1 Tax=Plastorhodobacter daqingensis TaxID=1387281 RepID=A0ABW2UKS0_9RHOB